MSIVTRVIYVIGPIPDWYNSEVHDVFLEERLIETAMYLYGSDIKIEFEYDDNLPHQKILYAVNDSLVSITEYKPVMLLNKVKKDAEIANPQKI